MKMKPFTKIISKMCISFALLVTTSTACNSETGRINLRTKSTANKNTNEASAQKDQSSANANTDSLGPRLTAQSLLGDHSYGVAVNVVLTLTFDRPLDMESVKSAIAVTSKDGASITIITTQKQQGFLEIAPQKLLAGKTYTLSIQKTLKDIEGNVLEKPIELLFTTALVALPSGGDAIEDHVCLINFAGEVFCRGDNALGQLGTPDLALPVKLPAKATRVATSASASCVLLENGSVYCWGQGNAAPSIKAGLTNIVTLSAHSNGFCSLSNAGKVQCWGDNKFGQLGNGQTQASIEPVVPTGLDSGVLVLGTGTSHSCAVHAVKGLYCWGTNGQGQLGIGTTMAAATPTLVTDFKLPPEKVRQIDGGLGHTCLVTTDSEVYCWGDNMMNQLSLANVNNALKPVKIDILGEDIQSIDIGHSHSCATTVDGAVKCWGWNLFNQLGNGGTANAATPVEVLPATDKIQFIISSHFFTMSVSVDGQIKIWGSPEELAPNASTAPVPANFSI